MARSVTALEMLVDDLTNLLNNDLYLGALTTADMDVAVCFDCDLWLNGYTDNNGSILIEPIRKTTLEILSTIKVELNTLLSDKNITDYGFKTQVERLLSIVDDLFHKITLIQCCYNICDTNLMSEFLSALIITICQLIVILEYLNGLMSYYNYCDCIGKTLFSLLMGKFINAITELQSYLGDWYSLVVVFFQFSSMSSKNYVASYMPATPIKIPPYPMPISHACVPCPTPKPIIPNECNCSPCKTYPN